MNDNIDTCMVCGSTSNNVIHTKIREKIHNVVMCSSCNFVFLQNYENIDYSFNYGGLTLSKDWTKRESIIKRSESLKRFNKLVSHLIKEKQNCSVLKIGASIGASIYGLNKLIGISNIDCIELNNNDRRFLKDEFDIQAFSKFSELDKKYQVIYGHHVFEHFTNPKIVLNEIYKISSSDCKLYFSLPNFNDFYSHTLNDEQKDKYITFNFHLAHPYYYTVETFSRLIDDTAWKISSISTIQDYSIVNYFNWYINGVRSPNIESGVKVNNKIEDLNSIFIDMVEKANKGNNISVVLEKR